MQWIRNNNLTNMIIADVRRNLDPCMQINNIDGFDLKNVQEVNVNCRDYIDINYESLVHLFYNMYIAMVFKNHFPIE